MLLPWLHRKQTWYRSPNGVRVTTSIYKQPLLPEFTWLLRVMVTIAATLFKNPFVAVMIAHCHGDESVQTACDFSVDQDSCTAAATGVQMVWTFWSHGSNILCGFCFPTSGCRSVTFTFFAGVVVPSCSPPDPPHPLPISPSAAAGRRNPGNPPGCPEA